MRKFKTSYNIPDKVDVITNDWDNIKPAKKEIKEVKNDSWDSFEHSNRRNNRRNNIAPVSSENNEASKKFGGAKSISSTQYFGDNQTSVSYFVPRTVRVLYLVGDT